MGDLFSGPHIILVIVIIPAIFLGLPILFYFWGFRNGKREGERNQLQQQIDANRKG
jgi:hypothetical protein